MARRNKLSTKIKRKIAKTSGIPTTKSGRKQKMRRMLTGGGCLLPVLTVICIVCFIISFF